MSMAAAAGKSTSHGGSLTQGFGSNDVKIGNMNAWRATVDFAQCSLANGTVPHVGGVVLSGSATVKINNFAAVRTGDQIVETGSSNAIVDGIATVQIGG